MFVERNPFPYLEPGQYAGLGNGEIVFLDKTIPDDKKEWIREKYREWWKERQDEIRRTGFM